MDEAACLSKMVPPGQVRPAKAHRGGVIQILVTSLCDLNCFSCTQSSNSQHKKEFMTPEMFDEACNSLRSYWGTVGCFGGNPCISPYFTQYCDILRNYFSKDQCGLWSNNPLKEENGIAARKTFNEKTSNLNCHLSQEAYLNWKKWWPESMPFGHDQDSRHSPPFVAMRDVLKKDCSECVDRSKICFFVDPGPCQTCGSQHGEIGKVYDIEEGHRLISGCDVNQKWSASIGMFRGQLRAWFCELAMAQDILHQDDPSWPDNGLDPTIDYHWYHRDKPGDPLPKVCKWWELPMHAFREQVRWSCHRCSVPLNGYGELSQSESPESKEQVSAVHADVFKPKRKSRPLQLVTDRAQLEEGRIKDLTRYLQNGKL